MLDQASPKSNTETASPPVAENNNRPRELGSNTGPEATISPLHKAARAYAEAGLPIFPCSPGDKKPACANGFKDATTSAEQIDRWWTKHPNANIGLCPEDAGWCAVDLDPGSDEAWAALLAEHGEVAPGIEQATPRGGKHLIFAGSLPQTASKLAPHIDTRGRVSYILIAPSVVGGKAYRVTSGDFLLAMVTDLSPVPKWISERLATAHGGVTRTQRTGDLLDFPGSAERATAYLKGLVDRKDIAIEGSGGDLRTYQLACTIVGLGCSEETAVDLITEHWDPHCRPPWGRDGIATKVDGACSYMQQDQGHLIGGDQSSAKDRFGAAAALAAAYALSDNGDEKLDEQADALAKLFRVCDRAEFKNARPEGLLIPGLALPRVGVGSIIAYWKSLKGFVLLDLLGAVITGEPAFGKYQPRKTGSVIYAAGEGQNGIKSKRIPAWEQKHPEAVLAGRLGFMGAVPHVMDPAHCEAVRKAAHDWRDAHPDSPLRIIAFDTYSRMLPGQDENAAGVSSAAMGFADALSQEFQCLILIIHHLGKDRSKGARGASAFSAGMDWQLDNVEMLPDPEDDTPKPPDHAIIAHYRVQVVKDDANGEDVYLEAERVALPAAVDADGDPVAGRGSLTLRAITRERYEQLAPALRRGAKDAGAGEAKWLRLPILVGRVLERGAIYTDAGAIITKELIKRLQTLGEDLIDGSTAGSLRKYLHGDRGGELLKERLSIYAMPRKDDNEPRRWRLYEAEKTIPGQGKERDD